MNLLILLYLIAIAPKLFLDRVLKGKRHPGFLQRLGFNIPTPTAPTIWIHAVSVGEVKAAGPLLLELRKKQPNAFILLTTTTATGQAEAKRSLKADAFAYLPLDFTFVVRKWIKKLNPTLFIFVESDFWPNLLKALRKNNTRIALVSGKMSSRSSRRFHFFLPFSRRIFSYFDHICLQDASYLPRFQPLVPSGRLHVTGNLKLDIAPQPTKPLNLPKPAITISCTHPGEEEQLLDALLDGPWFIILAPRHPERFKEVAALLTQKKISFSRWSDPVHEGQLLLVDTMGQLALCYSHSRLAIVAGSYVTHIGGHNVLEPTLYNTPVFFGPHTYGQREFATRAIESGAGKQVPLLDLRAAINEFFAEPKQEESMKAAAALLMENSKGAALRTAEIILAGTGVPKPLAKD